MLRTFLVAVLVLLAGLPRAEAGDCTHTTDTSFYDTGFTIGKIEFVSSFDFFFLVRQRFDAIKRRLPLKEGDIFESEAYDQSFDIVRDALKADGPLGNVSPVKIVTATGGLKAAGGLNRPPNR